MGPGAEPVNRHSLSHGGGHDVVELYPSEFNELKIIVAQVQGKFSRDYATEDVQKRMSLEIQHRLAEELGLLSAIEWKPTDVVQMDGENRPVLTPNVSITGRTDRFEVDHDRIRREVQGGEMDGHAGKIDEHGNWKQ